MERLIHPSYSPESVCFKPTSLSKRELLHTARMDFVERISGGEFSEDRLDWYVNKRVNGVSINGTDIVFIDYEHDYQEDPILGAYLSSLSTSSVLVEYFYPELVQTVASSGVLGRLAKTKRINIEEWAQTKSSKALTKTLSEIRAPVVVADMANKPLYAAYYFSQQTPCIAPLVTGIYRAVHEVAANDYDGAGKTFAYWGALQMAVAFGLLSYLEKTFPSAEKLTSGEIGMIEKLIPFVEQLRRYHVADGLRLLATEYPPLPNFGKERSQIIALYPEVHRLRIVDNLLNPHPIGDRVRNGIGRVLAPGLDYSIRTWKYNNLNGDPLTDWRMVSNRNIPL